MQRVILSNYSGIPAVHTVHKRVFFVLEKKLVFFTPEVTSCVPEVRKQDI